MLRIKNDHAPLQKNKSKKIYKKRAFPPQMCLSASENQVLDGIPVLNIHPCNRWHSKPFLFFGASRQKKRNTRLPVGRTRSFFSFSFLFPFFPLIPSIHPSIHRLPENARPFSLSSSPGCSPCENHVIILNLRGSTLTMGLSAPPPPITIPQLLNFIC